MKIESLSQCIATLNTLRDQYHGQLDVRRMDELDSVIAELTRLSDNPGAIDVRHIPVERVLKVTAEIIGVVTNVAILMRLGA